MVPLLKKEDEAGKKGISYSFNGPGESLADYARIIVKSAENTQSVVAQLHMDTARCISNRGFRALRLARKTMVPKIKKMSSLFG